MLTIKRRFTQTISVGLLVLMSSGVCFAQAGGYLRIDTSGFLRHSDERGDASSSIIIGPEHYSEGPYLASGLDLKAVAFLQDRNSFSAEAASLFVSTSKKWLPHHQITLGRRVYDWSVAEEEWNQGFWSPRFLWNPLKPERIGLTGAFYTYESTKWRVLAFATPISPPERSYPIRAEDGRLSSPSPDWVPPFTALSMMNQQIGIHYEIAMPAIRELLFRPGSSIQVRYGEPEQGPWASWTYGVMPMHQAQLGVEAGFSPAKGYVEAMVHPVTQFHQLMTMEGGMRGKLWSFWSSTTVESPIQRSIPASWQVDPMGPALVTSMGGELKLEDTFALSGSYYGVDESKPSAAADAIALNLPSRFGYTHALQLQGHWTGFEPFSADARLVYDLGTRSGLASADFLYQLSGTQGQWTVGMGADLINARNSTGWVGQFIGNDRVRVRLSYAF